MTLTTPPAFDEYAEGGFGFGGRRRPRCGPRVYQAGLAGLAGLAGMGGVFRKSGFTPAALAPALWLDATRGVLTDGAAQFTAANSESLSNAGLALGNTDWWLAGWVYADSLPANACIITKDDGGTTDINYNVLHSAGSFQFAFRNLAGSFVTVSGAGLTTGAWKFFIAYHDSVNDLIGVSVNGGAFTTAATGGITPNSATSAPFRLGARATVAALFWDGRQDSMCVGNAPVGGIAGLATTIRDSLYNAGAGKCYSDLTDAEKTAWGLVSFWNLDEISGTRSDAHGSNHLTDNNTVTYAAGLASGAATADGAPISQWTDLSGNARHVTQTTGASRPVLKLAIQNGLPVIRGDGTDDTLLYAGGLPQGDFTVCVTAVSSNVGSDRAVLGWGTRTSNGMARQFHQRGGAQRAFVGSNADVNSSSSWAANTWSQWTVTGSGVPSSGSASATITHRVNGAAAGASTATLVAFSSNTLRVFSNTAPGEYWIGDVAEMIVYPFVLSAANILLVEAYLKTKWGTP